MKQNTVVTPDVRQANLKDAKQPTERSDQVGTWDIKQQELTDEYVHQFLEDLKNLNLTPSQLHVLEFTIKIRVADENVYLSLGGESTPNWRDYGYLTLDSTSLLIHCGLHRFGDVFLSNNYRSACERLQKGQPLKDLEFVETKWERVNPLRYAEQTAEGFFGETDYETFVRGISADIVHKQMRDKNIDYMTVAEEELDRMIDDFKRDVLDPDFDKKEDWIEYREDMLTNDYGSNIFGSLWEE